jgi:hypothetical protein
MDWRSRPSCIGKHKSRDIPVQLEPQGLPDTV